MRVAREIRNLTVFEIVLTLVLAVALGVAFWGWTFVYDLAKPFLKVAGLSCLVAGFWILASVFIPNIIRKPGVALVASLMAAFVESLLTHWGLMSIMWGLVQGLGAEIVFLSFSYRKWNIAILMLAASISTLFSFTLDYFYYSYGALSPLFNLTQLVSFLISSLFFAGWLSDYLGKRLVRLGLLDQFKIAKG